MPAAGWSKKYRTGSGDMTIPFNTNRPKVLPQTADSNRPNGLEELSAATLSAAALSAAENERFIRLLGRRFLAAMARQDFDLARHWLTVQHRAVLSRSPDYVAQLERERGLT